VNEGDISIGEGNGGIMLANVFQVSWQAPQALKGPPIFRTPLQESEARKYHNHQQLSQTVRDDRIANYGDPYYAKQASEGGIVHGSVNLQGGNSTGYSNKGFGP